MIQFWRYGIGVVLDGNSLKWKISVQALKMIENKGFAGTPFKRCGPAGTPFTKCGHVRRLSEQKVRPQFTHSNAEKRAHVGILMFGPWYLARRS